MNENLSMSLCYHYFQIQDRSTCKDKDKEGPATSLSGFFKWYTTIPHQSTLLGESKASL